LQVAGLQRLADLVGAPGDVAARLADALSSATVPATDASSAPIRPETLSDMSWLGIDAATLERLAPYVDLLPVATAVNINTAPREVLVAAMDGVDAASAERLVQSRQRAPFENLDAVRSALGGLIKLDEARLGVSSSWFQVSGRLRLEERVVEERSLMQREGERVLVRRRERHSFDTGSR
jgi:general secretion pathway protein K